MENLLWFECTMESGHNIKGVSRVEAPRIKHTVENCGKENTKKLRKNKLK